MFAQSVRCQRDPVGDRSVPACASHAIHTLRKLEQFPITGMRISIGIVAALNPFIGYANISAVATEGHASGRRSTPGFGKGQFTRLKLDEILCPPGVGSATLYAIKVRGYRRENL